MADFTIEATNRTEFGKGAARRARRAGLIPAVMYGHGSDPLHVNLPGQETTLALRHSNPLLEIVGDGFKELAIPREIQRHPVKNVIEHVDLVIVKRGEKVEVEVPVRMVGEPLSGTIALVDLQNLNVLVEATNVPEVIEVDVQGLTEGAQLRTTDLALPAGVTLVDDTPQIVITVEVPRAAATEAAEEAEAEAAGSAADSTE